VFAPNTTDRWGLGTVPAEALESNFDREGVVVYPTRRRNVAERNRYRIASLLLGEDGS
jgi:hypothetical protein